MARSYNASNLAPSVEHIYGLKDSEMIHGQSAITEWKYDDVPPMPLGNTPPEEKFDTHECIRREPESQSQIFHFFTTGYITQTCNGPCRKPYCEFLKKRKHDKDSSWDSENAAEMETEPERDPRILADLTDFLPRPV